MNNGKMLYTDEKSKELGEIKKKNRKVKKKNEGTVLLLCLTYFFNLFDLGDSIWSIKTPASRAMMVSDVQNRITVMHEYRIQVSMVYTLNIEGQSYREATGINGLVFDMKRLGIERAITLGYYERSDHLASKLRDIRWMIVT